MQFFFIIEIVIFVLFIVFERFFTVSRNRMFAVFSVLMVSVLLEIGNEMVFNIEGTYYPDSVLYFPFFKFPLAIICLGCIYSCGISLVCLKISGWFNSYKKRKSVFIVSVLVLNFLSLLIESAGILSGYWIHKTASNIFQIWYFVYFFYLVILTSGAIFVFSELKENKN